MQDKLLLERIYPNVQKNLSQQSNQDAIKRKMDEYLNRNSRFLTEIGPMHQVLFSDDFKQTILDSCGIDTNEVKKIIKDSRDIDSSGMTVNPFNISMTLAIRYALLNNKNKLLSQLIAIYSASMYPLLYRKYFKYDPQPSIMEYVVNNMSNKFKLKTEGLWGELLRMGEVCLENNKKSLTRGYDIDCVKYVLDLRSRMNSFFKNIYREFDKAHKENNFVNLDSDNFDEDNYVEADNNMYVVKRFTDSAVMRLSTEGVDMRLVTYSAKLCQVSVNELRNYLQNIIVDKRMNDLRKITECILYLYINDSQENANTIKSNKFLIECLNIYKKANSTDKNIITIKELLDKLLKEGTNLFAKTTRLASINNYRRALFTFFVLNIQMSG